LITLYYDVISLSGTVSSRSYVWVGGEEGRKEGKEKKGKKRRARKEGKEKKGKKRRERKGQVMVLAAWLNFIYLVSSRLTVTWRRRRVNGL
jgi:hypothetical protein